MKSLENFARFYCGWARGLRYISTIARATHVRAELVLHIDLDADEDADELARDFECVCPGWHARAIDAQRIKLSPPAYRRFAPELEPRS